jgi:hypothetical protein
MSLLSQFFPSGSGGGFSIAQKIEILMVGGGGGGGASGGNCIDNTCCSIPTGGIVGGGGGGGQVVFSDGYEVIQDVSYPITVGAGGAGGGFYYDTTNVYYPRNPISPPVPVGCYCPQIQCRNAGTLRGSNGGNTIFGSVVAYGGGGGGGGMSNTVNYLPTTCNSNATAACSEWTAKGADGGTGGGSGSGFCGTGDLVIEPESPAPDVRPGKAIYNSSLQFLKSGADGIKFKVPSLWPTVASPAAPSSFDAVKGFSMLTFATGGGGNTSGAGAPVAGADICLKTPADSVACMNTTSIPCFGANAFTGCPGGQGFYAYCCSATGLAAINAFMEGTLGGSSSVDNQYSACNDFSASLRGGDGYETTITPSPEYYGGGGAVTQASGNGSCTALLGAVMSPGHPCYPASSTWQNSPFHAWLACPYGGAGGGGSVCTPLMTCRPTSQCFHCTMNCAGARCLPSNRIVGVCCSQCGLNVPVPGCICPGAGQTNCGGGGASFHGGFVFASTGPVFPNPTSDPGGADTCAFCGYAGGSGTVVIRYPTVFCAATVSGNTPITPQSGYHIYRFNGPGTITFPSS